jgi:glycosyltransferase involved in cell wall biosynthesis
MKVALFGSYAPSLILFRGPLISELIARGHQVWTLAPDIDAATEAQLRKLGATPVAVPLGRTSLNPLGAAQTMRRLAAELRAIGPDVLLAYTIKPILLGERVASSLGIRFVPMVTGLGYAFLGGDRLKRRLLRWLAVRLYQRALAGAPVVIFQNPDDRADFIRLGILPPDAATVVVAGSGIDVDRFAEQPLPAGAHVLMIARLLRDKGVREFAAAAKRLRRVRPDARVSLAGWRDSSPDSISERELKAMQAGGVTYLGRVEDVRAALADCSIYVLPSYREGTPRSVLEALAVGRPVITTDVPGVPRDGRRRRQRPARPAGRCRSPVQGHAPPNRRCRAAQPNGQALAPAGRKQI